MGGRTLGGAGIPAGRDNVLSEAIWGLPGAGHTWAEPQTWAEPEGRVGAPGAGSRPRGCHQLNNGPQRYPRPNPQNLWLCHFAQSVGLWRHCRQRAPG